MPFTQYAALGGALQILADLRDDTPCDLHDDGCHAHGWPKGDLDCPQRRLKFLLRDSGQPPAYSPAVLRAALRGLTRGHALHVSVRVNGHKHTGELLGSARRAGDPNTFRVRLSCGDLIESLDAADVLDLDVHADPTAGDRNEFGERYDHL